MKMLKLTILFFLILLQGCGPTTTGNPVDAPVALRMQDQQPFAFLQKAFDTLVTPAYATVSNVKFCFKRLRFKPDSVTTGSNFDLNLGQVDINPAGTNLVTVTVPKGTYQRIEFDLDKECDGVAGKPSVSFTNSAGSFSSIEHITIKFEGTYTVTDAGTLTLNIDNLLNVIDALNPGDPIKDALESSAASGRF